MSIEHSTCKKRVIVASLVLQSGKILTASNSKLVLDECAEDFCIVNGKCENTMHAEQVVMIEALKLGHNLKGCKLLVTKQPCIACLKMAVYLGVKEILYEKDGNGPVYESKLYKRLAEIANLHN